MYKTVVVGTTGLQNLIKQGYNATVDTAHGGNIDLKKCHFINNGVDLEALLKSTEESKVDDEDLADEKFNVVYAGAISPVNNVVTLSTGLLK